MDNNFWTVVDMKINGKWNIFLINKRQNAWIISLVLIEVIAEIALF